MFFDQPALLIEFSKTRIYSRRKIYSKLFLRAHFVRVEVSIVVLWFGDGILISIISCSCSHSLYKSWIRRYVFRTMISSDSRSYVDSVGAARADVPRLPQLQLRLVFLIGILRIDFVMVIRRFG